MKKADSFFSNMKHQELQYVPIPDYDPLAFHFIGKSPIIKELFKTVGMVSMSRATVHISGESGTGKELVAKSIHQHGENRTAPFISVNCSAIVETLLESELFGHVKGSFTGAISNKEGKFSLAKNGTIFLDEIGEMSFNLQAKLLRVLQEREFEMVGGKEKLRTECRMISATNTDLSQMVKEGRFREDLYYRLKVINIHIPPIRDRMEDIPYLLLHFLSKTNNELRRNIRFVSRDAIDFLMSYTWKGNIREIENTVTHVVAMTQDDCLTKSHFMAVVKGKHSDRQDVDEKEPENVDYPPLSLNEVEKKQVRKILEYTKWHKGKTCEILGISRPRLDRKMKKYDIKPVQSYIYEN
jgi:two-component system response regulator AtoC